MKSRTSEVTFFFFNDTATTEIYTLSLHDALPICSRRPGSRSRSSTPTRPSSSASGCPTATSTSPTSPGSATPSPRSEEHTSELQSRQYLVCRLLLEKKNLLAS